MSNCRTRRKRKEILKLSSEVKARTDLSRRQSKSKMQKNLFTAQFWGINTAMKIKKPLMPLRDYEENYSAY